MKPLTARLQFYLRKSDALGAARIAYITGRSAKKPPANRYARLMTYKAAVYARYLDE